MNSVEIIEAWLSKENGAIVVGFDTGASYRNLTLTRQQALDLAENLIDAANAEMDGVS